MKIIIGADPGGYELKEAIKKHLTAEGGLLSPEDIKDVGVNYLPTGEMMDPNQRHYPLVAEKAALEVAAGNYDFGILICGTGIGIGMAANKIPGIRAATVHNHYEARYTRLHNNANILCLGGRVIGSELAFELVDLFLPTEPEGGRHALRVDMIRELETKYHR